MRLVAILVAFSLFALGMGEGAFAQPEAKRAAGKERQMNAEERQRMREDMRDVYRDRQGTRPERPRQMSPEERERLRRDVEDANRTLRRR
jgi:hypothetical protein